MKCTPNRQHFLTRGLSSGANCCNRCSKLVPKLSDQIKRYHFASIGQNLREQLRTGLVSQSATAVHQLAAGALTPNRSGVKAHANNLPHSVYIDSSSPLQAASGWRKPSWHTGGPGSRGGCHCPLGERMPATAVTTRSQHSHVTGGLAAQARFPTRVLS